MLFRSQATVRKQSQLWPGFANKMDRALITEKRVVNGLPFSSGLLETPRQSWSAAWSLHAARDRIDREKAPARFWRAGVCGLEFRWKESPKAAGSVYALQCQCLSNSFARGACSGVERRAGMLPLSEQGAHQVLRRRHFHTSRSCAIMSLYHKEDATWRAEQ